jgi:hypothetical protein
LIRLLEIRSYYSQLREVEEVKAAFPKVDFRYLVTPSVALPGGNSALEFTSDDIKVAIAQGYEDAKKVIQVGSGKVFEAVEEFNKRTFLGEKIELHEMF